MQIYILFRNRRMKSRLIFCVRWRLMWRRPTWRCVYVQCFFTSVYHTYNTSPLNRGKGDRVYSRERHNSRLIFWVWWRVEGEHVCAMLFLHSCLSTQHHLIEVKGIDFLQWENKYLVWCGDARFEECQYGLASMCTDLLLRVHMCFSHVFVSHSQHSTT